MTSYTTVSGCKLYQQNQGFSSLQNAQKTLKCIECGAVFMNYQELYLHSRLHIPFLPESNIPHQHMHIVESQNTFLNSIHDDTNNPSELTNRTSTLYSTAESNVVSDRAACALHCSLCNHTFTNRTQLINHSFAHDTRNIDLLCDEETIEIKENSNPVDRHLVFERSVARSIEKCIPNLPCLSQSSMNENSEMRNTIFSDNILLNTEQLNNTDSQQNVIVDSETILPVSLNVDVRKIFEQNRGEKVVEECFLGSNCLKCKEKFNSKKLDNSKNKKYKCQECARLFLEKSKLQTHWLSHSDRRPFKCSKCDKAYASKSKLNAHLRLHTKSNIHQCKLCNKIFTYPSYLEEHMKSHKSNTLLTEGEKEVLNFECTICKKRFRLAKILNAHLRLHSGKGLSQCNICDKKFNQKYSLKVHLQTHEAKKLHKCKYCDKSFTQKSNLVEHIRIHTKVKPFECNLCNKKFSQSSHLKSHIASHNSIRQHQCQLCGKRFKLSNHLKRHLNSHTGSKIYKCDKCNQMFSQAFSLKRHLKRHEE